MSQSRLGSLAEAWANVLIGFGIQVTASGIVLPLLGVPITLMQNFKLGCIMTIVSICRSYFLRRVFNKTEVILSWLRRKVPRLGKQS